MKRKPFLIAAIALALSLPAAASALELDSFLGEINVTAHADIGRFRADLSATFGSSPREIDGLFEIFDSPADVYITLRIGEIGRVSIARVVTEYRAHRGQGWGAVAKGLGIKPGSAEFHALKQGRLAGHKGRSSTGKPDKGHGKSKSRGHG